MCYQFQKKNMSDISNTNGAGDAENVAKVSCYVIVPLRNSHYQDKLEIKKLVQQLDEINVSNGATDIEVRTIKFPLKGQTKNLT